MRINSLKTGIILLLIIFISGPLHGQFWKKLVKKERAAFHEIQKAAAEYWKNQKGSKRTGLKQYKRWEWFTRGRLNENGYYDPGLYRKALRQKRERFAAARMAASAAWVNMGPTAIPEAANIYSKGGMGRLNCIAFDPTDSNTIWAGAPSGGLWKSADGGMSWSTTTDHLTNIGVSDILIHPQNSDIMYIATGDGDAYVPFSTGVIKSTDRGVTWKPTGLDYPAGSIFLINKMLMHPSDPDTILIACLDGVYKTKDAGAAWREKIAGFFRDIEVNPSKPSVWYAAADGGGIYRSVNSGETWKPLTHGLPASGFGRIALAVTPASPTTLYALYVTPRIGDMMDGALYGVYRSTNGGDTWTLQADSPNLTGNGLDTTSTYSQGWYDLTLDVSPSNPDVVYVGGVNQWKSNDGGVNWHYISTGNGNAGSQYAHVDHHDFAFLPGSSDVIFSGNDGGLFKSVDAGANWIDLSSGLEIHQIYRIGVSELEPDQAVIGTQDNGSSMLLGNWRSIYGGDGMECIIDPHRSDRIYFSMQWGHLFRSENNGVGNIYISGEFGGDERIWDIAFKMDPKDSEMLYAASTRVYKTADGGTTWTTISGDLSPRIQTTLTIAPSDSNCIYTSDGISVFRTLDGGADWEQRNTEGLDVNVITDIVVHPHNRDIIWVTIGNYWSYRMTGKVFRSEDGGQNWADVSTGLPNVAANCAIIDPYSMGLYVGTDVGVFYSASGVGGWLRFDEGLPNVIVNELDIRQSGGEIWAATYGRGVWKTPLASPPAVYSPMDMKAIRRINRSMLQKEYLNKLTWEANTMNSAGNVAHYRVYQVTGADRNHLGDVNAGTFEYLHRKVADATYQYAITAVNTQGHESPPIYFTL